MKLSRFVRHALTSAVFSVFVTITNANAEFVSLGALSKVTVANQKLNCQHRVQFSDSGSTSRITFDSSQRTLQASSDSFTEFFANDVNQTILKQLEAVPSLWIPSELTRFKANRPIFIQEGNLISYEVRIQSDLTKGKSTQYIALVAYLSKPGSMQTPFAFFYLNPAKFVFMQDC